MKTIEICNEVAMSLISSLSGHSVFTYNTKRNFVEVRNRIQESFNEESPDYCVDIKDITLDSRIGNSSLWEWAKRMDKIQQQNLRDSFLERYKQSFYQTYFNSIFTNNETD